MGLFHKTEDRPTPKEIYNFRTYLFAAIAASSAALIGYDSAFIGGTITLDSFENEFHFERLSDSEVNLLSANIVSCYQAGAFFGAFFAYPVGHLLGRKLGLLIFTPIFLVGAALMLGVAGTHTFGILYAGRVLGGLGIGALSNLTPIYISELSPPAIRGRLVGFYEVGWQVGGLVGFWINYAVNRTMAPSQSQWLIPFGVQLIPAGLLMIGMLFCDESPRWLIFNGQREKGVNTLSRLRNLPLDNVYLREEIAQIDQAVDDLANSIGLGFMAPFREIMKSKSMQWRLFLIGSLFFWQNGSGINAINYYSPTAFKSIGVSGTNASLFSTGIFGVVKTVVTFIWIFFMVDYLGRRNLLLWGSVGGSISLWIVGGYLAAVNPTGSETSNSGSSSGGKAAVAFFYIYTVCYGVSWSGTPWVVASEMSDQNIRTFAQAFAAANNWFWNFIVARFTPQMFSQMKYGVWFFFAALQLLAVPFVYFLLPETKGVPLEQMDMLFSKDLQPWKAHKVVMDEIRGSEMQSRAAFQGEEEDKPGAVHVDGV
ncbi:quinate permease [Paecilomyces variotii No. 5]|uniref:Quinate transporter n=1 Tax=Byssochlamys spectabilis (strain No. 5 / NBRC 109023) TaxID=1356009 RepID=V5FSS2_BYSSN|nr:quinate permease [Paecilomyces variotii No. 5]